MQMDARMKRCLYGPQQRPVLNLSDRIPHAPLLQLGGLGPIIMVLEICEGSRLSPFSIQFACHMRALVAAGLTTLLVAAGACGGPRSSMSGEALIDSALVAHGASTLDRAVVTFRFRDDRYRLRHDVDGFHYRRTYTDSLGRTVTEGITNDSTYRRTNGRPVDLSPSERESIETTVNSVAYFTLLPEPLGDPAVQSTYKGRDTINGVAYHRVKVTFRKQDGGRDWQDQFMYWFRTDTYTMDYLAYGYGLGPEEEPGTRFREAHNARRINGFRIADYYNYTVDTLAADQLSQYPDLWARNAVRLVSRIELDSVQVRPL